MSRIMPGSGKKGDQLFTVSIRSQDSPMNWQVYMILCSDNSLYTGITTDVQRRFSQHRTGTGAKYFRGRTPQQLVYLEKGHDRSSASRREAQIKKLHPKEKRQLIVSISNQLDKTL